MFHQNGTTMKRVASSHSHRSKRRAKDGQQMILTLYEDRRRISWYGRRTGCWGCLAATTKTRTKVRVKGGMRNLSAALTLSERKINRTWRRVAVPCNFHGAGRCRQENYPYSCTASRTQMIDPKRHQMIVSPCPTEAKHPSALPPHPHIVTVEDEDPYMSMSEVRR